MIVFFKNPRNTLYAVETDKQPDNSEIEKFEWLFGGGSFLNKTVVGGFFIGPRKEMVTPWSTNAVEITQSMGINGVKRMEEFVPVKDKNADFDPMLQASYENLNQDIFTIDIQPEPIMQIDDIAAYNKSEGLALSDSEIEYLEQVSRKLGRKLTDSEVFGFSQVNSEHCRHKIFNGIFIIDDEEKKFSLFELIKQTSKLNPNKIISAYKDNVAFIDGPVIEQFAPEQQDVAGFFEIKEIDSVLSLKAETHNFPTTVEPFNGAATGSGGEIRDRMAGGKGSIPLAGTAVYMTSYPRLCNTRRWELNMPPRDWLYQTPAQILIKASNGASDFGNKFGQPLICGSLLTFEHNEGMKFGYDKVIMLAGGIGTGKRNESKKDVPEKGDKIVLLGGDNYRIGMGGGAVSSVATGEYDSQVELNAVQRSNPEMQKRVYNAIRALVEADKNPVVSIHDHGAGGHLNCFSELVEETGGFIDIEKLPVGDPTLSAKEIIGNESQERMGLILKKNDLAWLKKIAERERAPIYVVGETTGDMHFAFRNPANGNPIDWQLEHMFGNPPKTVLRDRTIKRVFDDTDYEAAMLNRYIVDVLRLEGVACKDWLTNKVDRSVTGRVAQQQTIGSVQLPLSDVAVVALDYSSHKGMATAIGHAPVAGLIDAASGSVLSLAEALTNLVWAPLRDSLKAVSLSANWMWPAKNDGENSRLYQAVEALSEFAIQLGINIPTGKDSMSMTQKYPNGDTVFAPGTVIISAVAEVSDIRKTVTPLLKENPSSGLIYIDFSDGEFNLGGSSFGQITNRLGKHTPGVDNPAYFKKCFDAVQSLITDGKVIAGHDVSAGGMITALLEMAFPTENLGMKLDLTVFDTADIVQLLFSEQPAVIIQTDDVAYTVDFLGEHQINFKQLGRPVNQRNIEIIHYKKQYHFDIDKLRDSWFETSYLLDTKQTGDVLAKERFENYKKLPLRFTFPEHFTGKMAQYGIEASRRKRSGIRAAIIREKGVNGDREMAFALHLAGFDVKDIHVTDLVNGRENLDDVNFIVFVGGFSNSDVLGSAKGWAGVFRYNEKAGNALDTFYHRKDTLSLGICNGCQLMVELDLIYPEHTKKPKMLLNDSHKFESSFLNVTIGENNSVMLNSLAGAKLGVWIAHAEGKFELPYDERKYCIPAKYSYSNYPANPNGSDFSAAAVCSSDGRHLAMMPHIERAFYPWHWAHYPDERKNDEITPWIEAFVNAKKWIETTQGV